MTAAVRFDVPPPFSSTDIAVLSISLPTDRAGQDVPHPAATRTCLFRTARAWRSLESQSRANVCGSFFLFSPLQCGPDVGFRRLLAHAIYDPELML
jgi:hypothetical protein